MDVNLRPKSTGGPNSVSLVHIFAKLLCAKESYTTLMKAPMRALGIGSSHVNLHSNGVGDGPITGHRLLVSIQISWCSVYVYWLQHELQSNKRSNHHSSSLGKRLRFALTCFEVLIDWSIRTSWSTNHLCKDSDCWCGQLQSGLYINTHMCHT